MLEKLHLAKPLLSLAPGFVRPAQIFLSVLGLDVEPG
jgi:hypothetical protein